MLEIKPACKYWDCRYNMPDTGSFISALWVLYRLNEIGVMSRQAWEGIKHSNSSLGSGKAHDSCSRPARPPHANDHHNLLHFPPIRAQSLLTASSQDLPHSQPALTPLLLCIYPSWHTPTLASPFSYKYHFFFPTYLFHSVLSHTQEVH